MRVYFSLPTTNNALGGVEHNSTDEPFTDERFNPYESAFTVLFG